MTSIFLCILFHLIIKLSILNYVRAKTKLRNRMNVIIRVIKCLLRLSFVYFIGVV